MTRPRIELDHIEDKDLRGIGLVALSWAFLEGAAERIIWRVSRIDDARGLSITTHMNYVQRLEAACTLVHSEFPDSPADKRLPKLAKHIRKNLSPERNKIVHNRVLEFGPGATYRLNYKARGRLVKELEPIDPQEYEITSKNILDAANELRSILADLIKLIEAKYDAPPP